MNGCRGGVLALRGSAVAGAPEYVGRLPASGPSGMGAAPVVAAASSTAAASAAGDPHRTSAFIRRVIPRTAGPGAGRLLGSRRRRQLDLAALHAHLEDRGVATERLPAAERGPVERVEEVVRVQRVVVEEQHP